MLKNAAITGVSMSGNKTAVSEHGKNVPHITVMVRCLFAWYIKRSQTPILEGKHGHPSTDICYCDDHTNGATSQTVKAKISWTTAPSLFPPFGLSRCALTRSASTGAAIAAAR